MLVTIKNKLPGLLDLSPLKDSSGRALVLRGNASAEIAKEDLEHPIIQRVKASGWIEVVDAAAPPPPPAAKTATLPPPPPPAPAVIKTSAPPEELGMPSMPSDAKTDEAKTDEAKAPDEDRSRRRPKG